MHTLSCILAVATLLSSNAQAWHLQVHNQIAFTAENLLSSRTLNVTASLLAPQYFGSIGRAAAWADTVRKDKNGKTFSYNWHFVGMQESVNVTNPPSTCSRGWADVCPDGDCVVAQIANQSSILRGCVRRVADGTYSRDVDCQQALMWVVHFIGDVGQPLHTSGTEFGGNGVSVVFNSTRTNLHNVWDQLILYLGASHPFEFSDQHQDDYFAVLQARMEQDDFEVPRGEWFNCPLPTTAVKDDLCAKRWALDSHALVCNAVYSEALNNMTDLMTSGYAARMFPVVELQLAKAAWRLAAWLNGLVDGVYDDKDDTKWPLSGPALDEMRHRTHQQVLEN